MLQNFAIFLGKLISFFSEKTSLGAGGTWPGEVALALQPNILQYFASRFSKGIILVAGTNGKTTTSLMIKKVLESDNNWVVHNNSGANLLNGLVSACIKHSSWNGSFQADYGVFEVDENTLPEVLKFVKFIKSKVIIVLLNLFRDQLDRYGEVDVIAEKWEKALREQREKGRQNEQESKTGNIQIIANADDPLVAHLGLHYDDYSSRDPDPIGRIEKLSRRSSRLRSNNNVVFFGVNDKTKYISNLEHATDSIFCLNF